jgi:hypothetical protein
VALLANRRSAQGNHPDLIQISGDRYNINTWHPDTVKAAAAKAGQNAPNPSK